MAHPTFILLLLTALTLHLARANPSPLTTTDHHLRSRHPNSRFVGGVYVMSNNLTSNTMIVYGRNSDGTLSLINPALPTGGQGAIFNSGIFDPLFSSFSVIPARRNRFILAVNAGSNSVSVFKVLPNFSLKLLSVTQLPGNAPVSVAASGSLVYVACADADGDFDSVMGMTGLVAGFRLSKFGRLIPLPSRPTALSFRPGAIKFSPDRRSLLVSNPFAGFNAISVGGVEEMFVYRVFRNGRLSPRPVDVVGSTVLGNEAGRALPGVIGFDVVAKGSDQYVVAPEFRVVGADAAAEDIQASSVSIWKLGRSGRLSPVQLDLLIGSSFTQGEIAACWIQFSPRRDVFWVSNTLSNSISAFRFRSGMANIETQVAGTGVFPVDLWGTRDGKYLYQLFSGEVGVFSVDEDGVNLTEIQRVMDVPEAFAQGIVAL